MWVFRRQLLQDLARWREAGWVTAEGEGAIRAELAASRRGPGLAGVLAILGAILLGFAIMSFVAANWQDMSRLLRLAIIFGALLGSYAAAAALFRRGLDAFAHAALLLAVAVFGAGIMLISQMYHIDGHPPDAVLVWALGALATGILVRSNAALAAATLLFGLWSGMEAWRLDTTHPQLLLAAGVLAAAFLMHRWPPGLHLVAALVTAWVIRLGFVLDGGYAHWLVAMIGIAVAVAAVLAMRREAAGPPLLPVSLADASAIAAPLLGYGMVIGFAGLFSTQFLERIDTAGFAAVAALSLGLLLGAIVYGLRENHRAAVWLGYGGFSVEILGIYFKTVGTLFGSSVFFLAAGLLVIALAALAWRLHQLADRQTGVST